MSTIVCATNAGKDSRAVHIAAYRRATESGSSLIFLHVVGGPDFTEQPQRMRDAILKEMEWLLHALIDVAQDRSGAADVESDIVLRTGDPRTEILGYLAEQDATTLLIGVPREGDESIFSDSTFDDFVTAAETLDVVVELVSTSA